MKILLTAFETYDSWESNSSWETLTELLKIRGIPEGITTRRYPVNLEKMRTRLYTDLEKGFDAVLHLGQRPGIGWLNIESIAINVAGVTTDPTDWFGPLVSGAPIAYQSSFPIRDWNKALRESGIPSSISYHAGTYLCNALMYLSHHWHAERGSQCAVGFIHLPLTTSQAVAAGREIASLPVTEQARAISIIVEHIRSWLPQARNAQLA